MFRWFSAKIGDGGVAEDTATEGAAGAAEAGARPQLPARLQPGSLLEVGEAGIELKSDGSFKACDRYGCAEALVPPGVPVDIVPVPAIYRLLTATSFIYVEFDRRVHVGGEGESLYWTLAPFELEVNIDGLTLIRLAPVKVKFTLIGTVTEGTLARYFKAPVARSPEELPEIPGTALLGFKVAGTSALLPGIGFNAAVATFFADRSGVLYYPLVSVKTDGESVAARTTSDPPKDGLVPIFPGERRLLPFPFTQQAAPFTMTIEVVRPRHTAP
ncbi:MAG: DUF432 domain-containing protein [Thermoproteota archaeon]